jgi:hypothetical protein
MAPTLESSPTERTETEMKILFTPISIVKLCGACLVVGLLVSFLF